MLERIALPLTEVRGLKPSETRPWVALLTSQMIGALVLQDRGSARFSRYRRTDAASHDAGAMPCSDGVEECEGFTQIKTVRE